MRYVILTTRHHDGFCLWNTETTDFNAVKIGPRRDLLRPFVEAARSAGLRVGFYFSCADWFHCDYPSAYCRDWPSGWPDEKARERFVCFYLAQLQELMTSYGAIDILWYDGCIPQPLDGERINRLVKGWQPDILINNRNGWPHDFICCEQTLSEPKNEQPWEACVTLNDNWGYHAGDYNWKTPRQVAQLLARASSSGGNLLLNIGPRADGTIPEDSVKILRAVGDWLCPRRHCFSGSGRSPYSWTNWGCITVNESMIFLHVFASPGTELRLANVKNRVIDVHCIDSGLQLFFEQKGAVTTIWGLPPAIENGIAFTITIKVQGKPETLSAQTSFWIAN
jgi:alpha-L-fucosidase